MASILHEPQTLHYLTSVAKKLKVDAPKLMAVAKANLPALSDCIAVRVVGERHRQLKEMSRSKKAILLTPKQQHLLDEAR